MDFHKPPHVHGLRGDTLSRAGDTVDMPSHDNSENHLRAWRKFRRLTQQQLADAVEPPTTKSVIGALESGERGLSDKWLRRLAPALGTTPGHLLDYLPEQVEDVTDVWSRLPDERKAEAREMLEVMAKRRA